MGAMPAARRWYSILYIQVLIAIAIGIAIGYFWPKTGAALKPLGDGFIQLIKMMIAPVIFCTIVHGIASMRDLTKVGRVGVKALVYFELVSTLALAATLGSGGALHTTALAGSALALLPSLAGMGAGRWLRLRVQPETFRTIFFCGLLVLGVYLTLRSALHLV